MRVNRRTPHFVVAALAAQALVACSSAGIAPSGQTLTGVPPVAVPGLRSSWIDPRAKSGVLLYVSDSNARTVFVYSYPQLVPAGQLTGFYLPSGLCVNRRNGNIWVTDTFNNKVFEFAHGGTKPIRTIFDSGEYFRACAVNAKTGDLAALTDATDDPSTLLIFKPGHTTSTKYSDYDHAYSMYFDAYDPGGNLFADATHYVDGHVTLEELAKGAQKLTNILWKGPAIRFPAGVQYDGRYLAIGNERKHLIYQTDNGTVVSTTTLKGACLLQQFFIYEGFVIASSWCGSTGNALIYHLSRRRSTREEPKRIQGTFRRRGVSLIAGLVKRNRRWLREVFQDVRVTRVCGAHGMRWPGRRPAAAVSFMRAITRLKCPVERRSTTCLPIAVLTRFSIIRASSTLPSQRTNSGKRSTIRS